MALNPVATVNISLNTTSISVAGFGTPIFFTSHRSTMNRVDSFVSASEVGELFGTESDAYKAALAYFTNTPSGNLIKIARREADAEFSPSEITTGASYTITIKSGQDTVTSEYVAQALDDEEAIVDGLITAIQADIVGTDIDGAVSSTKTGTGTAARLVLSPTASTDIFTAESSDNISVVFSSTETGADAYIAATNEDDDFYFGAAEFDETFRDELVTAFAADEKLFFRASSDVSQLDSPNADIPVGDREVILWHQEADQYPEMQWIGVNSVFAPDETSIVWAGNKLLSFSISRDPRTGNKLNSTQVTNVLSYGANIVTPVGGVPVTRQGKTVGGEWIDIIRGRDVMKARVKEAYELLYVNQLGSKVPFTASGIARVDGVVKGALQPFVDSGFLESFQTNPPVISNVSNIDKINRELKNFKFSGVIAGAINEAEFNGSISV